MNDLNATSLPLFLTENSADVGDEILLNEETSRHISQVLRMQTGERIELTNGQGVSMLAEIAVSDKRKSVVSVFETKVIAEPDRKIIIGISPIKNTGRFEWFLEKATELGVNTFHLLNCKRTEKTSFRDERFRNIIVSAMLQSRQYFLPHLYYPPLKPGEFKHHPESLNLFAHCGKGLKTPLSKMSLPKTGAINILIGPEGDFTDEEIDMLVGNGFQPVSLGDTRLRTETAGVVAATILRLL
jgi:16S rRNA (uracil1498-N3)-methyltransferase